MVNKHKLLRLAASLRNKPHLISKTGFEEIQSYLDNRNAGLMSFEDDSKPEPTAGFDSNQKIGVVTIRGPLTYRTSGWEAYCGGYSYEMLLSDIKTLIDSGVNKIVLDCDSGGGEAYGCFEATDEMRHMCDQYDVKLYTYIDGHACSAMYAIACAADTVTINPYGEAGSIGVLICLYNDSEYLKKNGIERTYITDGLEKVPFDDDGSWKEGFLEDLQTKVEKLGDDFRDHVSKYTRISVEDLKKTQARVYSAQDALSLGLVNQIMTRSEFINYVINDGAT